MLRILAVSRVALTEFFRQIPGMMLTYIAPVIMMSIFGLIFGSFGQSTDSDAVSLLVVDEDHSAASQTLVNELKSLSALELIEADSSGSKDSTEKITIDRAQAELNVREGNIGNALVIPAGFGAAAEDFTYNGSLKLLLLSDSSKPIEEAIVQGLLQRSLYMMLSHKRAMDSVDLMGEQFDIADSTVEEIRSWMEQNIEQGGLSFGGGDGGSDGGGGISIDQQDLLGEEKDNPMLSHQVAAWLTIFILFTMTASGGSLLRERSAGTLRRVLQSPISPTAFLAGKYIAFATIAFSQVLVMYLAGWAILGVDIFDRLGLLLFFGLLTAMAATGFGLVLAVLCRTQEELSGASTIVILAMSALGGSMFPSFLMPESIRLIGKLTFNGWAMQGYQDIFWRDQGFAGILLESAVMLGIALLALAVAVVLFNRRFVQAR